MSNLEKKLFNTNDWLANNPKINVALMICLSIIMFCIGD